MAKKIGIVGGGQLGRLMAQEARTLGLYTIVLDPTPNCPASEQADEQLVGNFTDGVMIEKLAAMVDVMTFEIELADADTLVRLADAGKEIHPTPSTLLTIKDKLHQKNFLTKHGIQVGPYTEISEASDIIEFTKMHGYPVVLKTRTGGYDGRGNRTISQEADIKQAMEELGDSLYVEAWVPFEKELAVVAARGQDGTIYTYDVVETVHVDHICNTVIAPALISQEARDNAEDKARQIMESFAGAGVFGIEMFYTADGTILINEIAPRVHNSGHLTLDGYNVSQFEQHIRAVAGLDLINPQIKAPVVSMINILGTRNGPADPQGVSEVEKHGGFVEIYGKHDTKIKRKMGHITVWGNNHVEAESKAQKFRDMITI